MPSTGMPTVGMPAPQAPAPSSAVQATMAAPGTAEFASPTAGLGAAPSAVGVQAVTQSSLATESLATQAVSQPLSAPPVPSENENSVTGPLTSLPTAPPPPLTLPPPTPPPPTRQPGQGSSHSSTAAGALSKLSGAVRGRRAARKPRLAMSSIFADLVDMADISRSAYAVDEEVTGAMCLFKTDGGYEVFSCAEDARHEVRFFEEEEAAYFYLFGVLAAEALRNGRLTPRRG